MRVSEIMSSPVIVTSRNVKVTHLRDLFDRKKIHAVPVLEEDGTIVGVVSSSDVAKCHDENEIAQNIMTIDIHVVVKNNRVKDAAKTMVKHGVHHLVVMEEGKTVGMLSSLDILNAYSNNTIEILS